MIRDTVQLNSAGTVDRLQSSLVAGVGLSGALLDVVKPWRLFMVPQHLKRVAVSLCSVPIRYDQDLPW